MQEKYIIYEGLLALEYYAYCSYFTGHGLQRCNKRNLVDEDKLDLQIKAMKGNWNALEEYMTLHDANTQIEPRSW